LSDFFTLQRERQSVIEQVSDFMVSAYPGTFNASAVQKNQHCSLLLNAGRSAKNFWRTIALTAFRFFSMAMMSWLETVSRALLRAHGGSGPFPCLACIPRHELVVFACCSTCSHLHRQQHGRQNGWKSFIVKGGLR
jgi:hypothetical protein